MSGRPAYVHPADGSPVDMMVTHVTYTLQDRADDKPPLLRLWCVLQTGSSVLVEVNDFLPYFYASTTMDPVLLAEAIRNAIPNPAALYSVDQVQRMPLMGYCNQYETMTRVTMMTPSYIKQLRDLFMYGGIVPRVMVATHEANVAYVTRAMVDMGISGCGWIRVSNASVAPTNNSTCSAKLLARRHGIAPIESNSIGPMRVLSFDIECCKIGKGFPTPNTDPVSQIALVLYECDKPPGTYVDRVVFSLGGAVKTPLEDPLVRVHVFAQEEDMLNAVARYIAHVDPDVFTGWNIDGFDWWYLFTRAKNIDAAGFSYFNRIPAQECTVSRATFQSKAFGAREDYTVSCNRVTFDMLKHMQRDRKLRSYTLNSVSKLILGTTKVDMPYELIPEYQNGTDVQRAHLCYYCYKDAELVLQIMNKTMAMINSIEQARVTGVPLDFLLSRGAQVKTQSNLLQLCLKLGFVVPSSTEAENQDKTKGAIVLEPTPGLHRGFICTLDFGSLYPSIMQHRNLCYSTKLPLTEAKARYAPSQYYVPRYEGAKVAFVQRNIRQGLLPMLLERILAARNQAKAELGSAKDPFLKSVLDGRQLALKIVANSVYGFTKANMVCDKDIMEAVTAEGRWMIMETKRIAEQEFGQTVIYGDTDSVFVLMPDKTLLECFQIGAQIAKRATEFFGAPHSLVVEKVFDGLLIGGKKRYGGKKYMSIKNNPELSAKGKPELAVKGFECVRRDNALIASGTLEKCLDMILMQNNVQGAIDYVHAVLRKLNQGTIDMSQLIISKCLSKTAAHYDESGVKQAHVELARKIANRGDEPPHTGDRVKYVIKAGHRKVKQKSLVAELAEDPLYMLQNGLAPNVDYYIEQQMMKPLVKIFTPILAPSERTWKINRTGEEADLTQTEWTRLTAYKMLFTGEHMRTIHGGGSNGLAISGFLVVGRRCIHCKLPSGAKTLCTSCRTSKGPEVLAHLVQKQTKAEIAYNAAWTRCQRCFGSLHVPVVCGNNDCDNFFHREAVKTRLAKVTADIEDLY